MAELTHQELDIAAAEIMGWKPGACKLTESPSPDDPDYVRKNSEWYDDRDWYTPNGGRDGDCPHPSEDISDAMKLVEKMGELEFSVRIHSDLYPELSWWATFNDRNSMLRPPPTTAKTLPLAITKAAVEAWKQHKT